MAIMTRVLAVLTAAVLLAGCAGDMSFSRGESYAIEGDWDRAVIEYREALRSDPGNVAFKTRLTKAIDQAATRHIERANHYIRENNPDAALYEANMALEFSPANNKAAQVIIEAGKLRDISRRMKSASAYIAAGRPNEALNEYYQALEIDPDHAEAKKQVEAITRRRLQSENGVDELSLASDQPITLSFKNTKIKEVFEFLSKVAGISIVFDEDVKDTSVTVFARDVSFTQALNLLLATNKLFMKKVADDAIIIIPKTKSKIDQYEDLKMKTFYLSNTKAKDMVNILRTMLETRKVIINEQINSITLREAPDKLLLAEKLIEANDMKDAEVVIDVEVLLADRNEDSNVGVTLPKGVSGTYDPTGSIASGALTSTGLPSLITNITQFKNGTKSDVDSKIWFSYPTVSVDWSASKSHKETLTNPRIRSLNNQPAKILIGSRVPVSTGQSAGGLNNQTSTNYEYREIGIKLNIEPNISLANDITLKTTLEVSDLGADVVVPSINGTIKIPRIDTTTVEATLNLRDGETVIIGGLLENATAESISGIAGLIDTPILGRIFSSNTVGPERKKELIMTLTPHIVRSIAIPRKGVTEFWSGTEEAYGTKPLFYAGKKEAEEIEPLVDEYEVPAVSPDDMVEEMIPQPIAEPAPPVVQPKVEPRPQPTEPVEQSTEPVEQPTEPVEQPTEPVEQPKEPVEQPKEPVEQPKEPAKPSTPADARTAPRKTKSGRVGQVSFAPEVAPMTVGQEMTIDITVRDIEALFEAPLSIIYNPKLVEFVSAKEGNLLNSDSVPTSFMATANDKVGSIEIFATRLGKVGGVSGSGTLFSLTFKGLAPGISPLVFKQNTLKDDTGGSVLADLKTGTLYIK